MEISGHRTRAMFDRYNIVDDRDVAEALQKRADYEAGLPKSKKPAKVAMLRGAAE
jgi:hypothetical protein